ncbi:AAA family ATPase, partial [Escherichia coli]|nr:AAA family ATPase [Escherichia coli]
MSKLKVERLIIRINTSDGIYGTDLKFGYGLNIISAENSSGKSTCIQSIIYALGLEGILGPSRKNPLKSALTTKLRDNNDTEIPVNESKIYLQLSNEHSRKITILRKSDSDISKIVTVYDCEFDKINPHKFTDYFLKDPGSAQREKGFHYFLSNFLGITQPEVIKYDGTKCPLYLESIFTVNYVEQTRGWGGILNVIPTYLGIKDLSQNVLEYTLNLDVREIRKKREIFLDEKKNLETKWANTISELESNAKAYGFFVSTRIPDKI